MNKKIVPAVEIWEGCYDKSLKGFISKESFAHPAKYSLGLIERIFDHCLEREYLRRGDLVGDCFGGVGIGGLVAGYRGLRWVGVELESKFYQLSQGNFEIHRRRLEQFGYCCPVMKCGDSRKFAEILQEGCFQGVVSSPPYGTREDGSGIAVNGDTSLSKGGKRLGEGCRAIVSSPPYAGIAAGAGGLNTKPAKHPGQQSGRSAASASQDTDQRYGQADGQIGALKSGDVQAVVSSPPWESNAEGARKAGKFKDSAAVLKCNRGHGASDAAVLAQAERDALKTYGESPGQIGREKGETYWEATAQVYRSCYLAIKPGGVIVLVVKDYVKNKQRVPLCDDTCRLLEHVGFTVIERIHAMLVKETSHGDLFNGSDTQTKSRKSFFRRLAEKKGSPKIDFEEVIIARKPI